MDFIVLDIIVLFGGVQALSLCIYLLFRKTDNKRAWWFFLFFLFFLALHNLGYAAIFMNFEIGFFNMGMQPIPYKYIIAPALFGYVMYSLSSKPISKLIRMLLIPAILYGILRCYWFFLIASRKNPLIIKEAYDLGFFSVNEVIMLIFNLIIGVACVRKIRLHSQKSVTSFRAKKYLHWIKTLSVAFISVTAAHLLLIFASYLFLGYHDRIFYYPTLIINSMFVYWIGFIGYSRSNVLFFKPLEKDLSKSENAVIDKKLSEAMDSRKIFRNTKLTSQQLATELDLQMHELTGYINNRYGVNFSQYLNKYRTREAIQLMSDDFLVKYSLDALAKEAGFNSKSSFYKVFKDQTGKTPSDYLKSLDE